MATIAMVTLESHRIVAVGKYRGTTIVSPGVLMHPRARNIKPAVAPDRFYMQVWCRDERMV
jgi:hypothetical protein